jgi:hypothetical protein
MNAIVEAAIDAEIAALARVVETPTAPFGFGADLSCDSDLDPARELGGFDPLVLGQAIVRRLDCPRGALPGDPDYGIDLRAMVNRGTTADTIRALGAQIRAELTKDDRIDRVTVTVTPSPTGTSLRVQLGITPVDPAIGGFSLTLAVTSAAVLLEEMRAT